MIDTALDWEILSLLPIQLAKPHVWLELDSAVRDPALIVRAAKRRLEAIRDAGGSEADVRDVVVSIIVAARQQMLALASEEGQPPQLR